MHYLKNINRIPEVADNILPERFGILAYRYKYKDKIGELVSTLKNSVKIPIVSAGSINSFERLDQTIAQGVWGFTIGGAFFEKKFVPDGSYRDNVAAVLKRLGKNI